MKNLIIKLSNEGKTPTEISKLLNVSYDHAFYISKTYGTLKHSDRRKYKRNSRYFSVIDTPLKSYFLGMLYADGNITNNLKTVRLKLIDIDKKIIEKLKSELEYEGKILNYKTNEIGNYDLNALEIYDPEMVKDLTDKGMLPNKSLTIKFPSESQVPENLMNHFIQGYFDGDGCICLSKNHLRHVTLQFCVSYDFGLGLKTWIEKNLDIHCTLIKTKNRIHKLSISGAKQCEIILDFIYKNSFIYCNRKWEKYLLVKKENQINLNKVRDKKSSKYKGVYLHKKTKKFVSFTKVNLKPIIFGRFDNEIDAAIAYNNGIKRLNLDKEPNII